MLYNNTPPESADYNNKHLFSCSEMIEQLQFDKSRGELSSTASCPISISHDCRLWVAKLYHMSYYSAQVKENFFFNCATHHVKY